MSKLGLIDYRDEFHLKTFRRWYLVKVLSKNTKFSDGVPLKKAAFVDFLLSNPPLLQSILLHFGRAEPSLNLEELLYKDNLEFGSAQDVEDFSKTCVLLISNSYMSYNRKDGEVFLTPDDREISLENSLSNRWDREIELLQPILNKSISVLSSAVLGGFNGS